VGVKQISLLAVSIAPYPEIIASVKPFNPWRSSGIYDKHISCGAQSNRVVSVPRAIVGSSFIVTL